MRVLLALLLLTAAPAARAEEVYLPPTAFNPASAGTDFSIDQGGLGCLRVNRGTGFFLATAPVASGATIESVTALVEDFNADALGMVTLVRRRATSFEALALSPPSQGGGKVEELTATPKAPLAAGADEAYLLQVLLSGPNVCFHGVRVRFR